MNQKSIFRSRDEKITVKLSVKFHVLPRSKNFKIFEKDVCVS